MSDNVAIKEGARAYNFTVDKLRTAQQDSDDPVIWVPESTVQLGSLRASENGVYLARSEDLYGFNEIVVSVNGAATIGDRAVFPDDDGQLHEEYLPHAIVIVTPPNKLIYNDGERIDLRGAVVIAVDENGHTWTSTKYPNGHIPLGELAVDPLYADITQAHADEYDVSGLGLNEPVYFTPVKVGDIWSDWTVPNEVVKAIYGGTILAYVPEIVGPGSGIVNNCFVSTTPGSLHIARENAPGPYPGNTVLEETSYEGQTFYLWNRVTHGGTMGQPWPHSAFQSDANALAKAFLYGKPKNPQQTITLSWARYGDGAVLSTSFNITVSDGFSGGSGNF